MSRDPSGEILRLKSLRPPCSGCRIVRPN